MKDGRQDRSPLIAFSLALVLVFAAWLCVAVQRLKLGGDWIAFPLIHLPDLETMTRGAKAAIQGYAHGYRRTLSSLGIFAMMVISFLGAGNLILRALRISSEGAERHAFSFLLGSGALSLIWSALVISGRAAFFSAVLVGVLGAALFIAQCVTDNGKGVEKDHSSRPVKILASALFFILLASASNCFPFQDFPDVLQVDLTLPAFRIHGGRIMTRDPFELYTHLPQNWWMLLTWPLLLKSEMAAALLVWGFHVSFVLSLWGFLRRTTGEEAALLAAALFISALIPAWLSVTLKADLPCASFIFAHYAALVKGMDLNEASARQARRWIFLAGILCGLAVGWKISAYAALLTSSLALAVHDARHARKNASRRLLGFWGLGLAVSLGPWLLYALVTTGNPFYPYLNRLFGLPPQRFFDDYAHLSSPASLGARGIFRHFRQLAGMSFEPDILSVIWGPTLGFCLLSLYLLRRQFSEGLRLALIGAWAGWLALSVYTTTTRYSLGFIVFCVCVPFALVYEEVLRTRPPKAVKIAAPLLILLCFHLIFLQSSFWRRTCLSVDMLLSGLGPENYATRSDWMDNLRWMGHLINTRTSKTDGILCIDTKYHCAIERKLLYNGISEPDKVPIIAADSKDRGELKEKLAALGVRHVLIGIQRFANSTDPDSSKIREMCLRDMNLRTASPNREILWYTFKDAPQPAIELNAEDVRDFPMMALLHGGLLFDQGNTKGALKVFGLFAASHVLADLKTAARNLKAGIEANPKATAGFFRWGERQ